MTIRELLEAAHMDAVGLLDDDEQKAFETAFGAAPPALRAQIRAEQARWARMDATLPDAEPPPELRERVLAAISESMSADASHAAVAGVLSPAFGGRRGVSPIWRAASIGLATAAALLLGAFLYVTQLNATTSQLYEKDTNVAQMVDALGNKYFHDIVFDERTRQIYFAPSDSADATAFHGQATLYVNPKWGDEARFQCDRLCEKPNETFRLVTLDDHNKIVEEVKEFTTGGVMYSDLVKLKPTPGLKIAIASVTRNVAATAATSAQATILMVATIKA